MWVTAKHCCFEHFQKLDQHYTTERANIVIIYHSHMSVYFYLDIIPSKEHEKEW